MSENNKTILIIGMGSIGKRHDRNLVELGCRTIPYDPIVYDPGPDYFSNALKDCDAVVIASPTSTHYNYFLQCMGYNKPIFVEKPIARNASEWRSLKYYIGQGANLFVGYNLRFHPCVIQAKQWLDDGKIGKVLWANFVCAQFNDKPEYMRDGVILNWSHEIDLALHLLGPAIVTGSSTRVQDTDTMTDILLLHETACMTTVHLDYVTKPERRGFLVQGTRGQIQGHLPHRTIALLDENDMCPEHHTLTATSYDTDYINEMKAFLDHIDGKPHIGCTGEEARDVLEICLKVREQCGLPT